MLVESCEHFRSPKCPWAQKWTGGLRDGGGDARLRRCGPASPGCDSLRCLRSAGKSREGERKVALARATTLPTEIERL